MKRIVVLIALALSSQVLTGCAAEPVVAALTAAAARPSAPPATAPAPTEPTAVAAEGASITGDARD